jgi:hypothetical protein
MNRFTQKRSILFFVLGWLFVVALFADGANLDDLIPGTVVVHSDEDYSLQTDAQLLTQVSSGVPVNSHSLPQHFPKHETSKPSTPLKIVYDQDSDSIAADPVLASESYVIFPPEDYVYNESATPTQSLYLLHCSLLI